MKLGSFEIPDLRLIPTTVGTLEEIYKVKKRDRVQSKDLAILLGFKYGTEPHYYRKIHALTEYGLLEGKGTFQVSELGEKLLHPRNDLEKEFAKTNAVLNVQLWKEIYQKHGKKPRDDNFWAVLVDIAKVDPETAKTNASKILRWYLEDIGHVSEDALTEQKQEQTPSRDESKGLSLNASQSNQMSQAMMTGNMPEDSLGRVALAKGGYIDVIDETTLEIAKSYIKVFEQKIKEKNRKSPEQPQES